MGKRRRQDFSTLFFPFLLVQRSSMNKPCIFPKTQNAVKFLSFGSPENIALIYLKFKQRGRTLGCFVEKMQM